MSRSPRTRRTPCSLRTVVATGAVMAAMLTVTGCGAGQITQTSTQVSAVGGALATIGNIAVRDAEIEYENAEGAAVYAVGGNAPLNMHIINTGADADRLVSASSPVAQSVQVGGTTTIPGGRVLLVEGEGAAPEATVTSEASGEVVPSGTAGPTTAAVPTEAPGPLPAPTSAEVAPSASTAPESTGPAAQVVLTGVTQQIRPGLTYAVTLVFERAGSVTVNVPVANPAVPRTESAPE